MKKDNLEYFDIVNEIDEVIGKIAEDMQNTIRPSQMRFINILILTYDKKIIVPKRSSNRKIFPNCYDFSVGGHVNSGEEYDEAAYRELKEELGISNVELQEIAYFSPFTSDSNTFQKVYILEYNNRITNYDKDGIEEIYFMTEAEIRKLMMDKPNLFKNDYLFVMNYLFENQLLKRSRRIS
ncbi:MAG: NUDIX domain-containing protein [Clostridia bacterium]|nr:NUDIX domain-containing protein [Clostridia bacterium]